MNKIYTLLFFLACSISSRAQTAASYSFTSFTGTYTPVTGGTNANILADDLTQTSVPLGFSFIFCGVSYNQLSISSNGWMSFANNANNFSNDNTLLTDLAANVPALFPLWDDVSGAYVPPGTVPTASYIVTGTAPNRVFTMDWRNWGWDYLSSSDVISFQVKLYETTGVIQYIYSQGPNAPNAPSASIGIAKTTTDYQFLTNSGAAPVSSTTVITTTIATKPATNQVYQWTPPPPPPAPTVTSNSPICPGATLTITATSTTTNPTYTLTGPGISTTTNNTGIFTIPNATTANTGTFNVTVTTTGGISPAGTTAVSVLAPPTISISNITSPTSCAGTDGSFQLNGLTANTTYTLRYRRNNVQQAPASITSTAAGTYVVGNLTAATYDSIRVFTSIGCVSNTLGPIIVSDAFAPATPVASFATPLCNNGTLQLSVSNPNAAGTYNWIGPVGYTASGPNATRPGMNATLAGIYSVTVTVAGCVSNPANVNVVMTPPDAPPVPNNVTYCQFETPLPLSAVGTNLRWYTTATGGTGTSTPPTPSTQVPTTPSMVWYVSQTAVCESPRVPLTVIVKPKPAPPAVASTTVQFCQYQQPAPTLSASGSAVRWYSTPTGGVGSATAPTVNTLFPGTLVYFVSQTVNGCESDRLQITVTIRPKPAPPTVQSPLNICQGDQVTLSALGQSILWYTSPTAPGGVPSPLIPNTGYEDSFFYYATQTVQGCESDRSLLKVVVNYKPNGIIVTSRSTICQGDTDSFFYYGNARPDAVYSWKSPQPQSTVLGGGGQGPFIVRFNAAGQHHVELTVNNKGCISTLISQLVNVKPLPELTFIAKDDACLGEIVDISLNGITPQISVFDWSFGGGTQIYGGNDGGPFGIRYNTPGPKVVSVTATAKGCDSRLITDTIDVHPLPRAVISILSDGGGQEVCSGDSVHLAVEDGGVGDRYKWSPEQFFYPRGDTMAAVWARPTDTRYVRVDVLSTETGCRATDSILLSAKPCCNVYLANAFSPNGDTRNDFFRIITEGHHQIEVFRVINRWGQVVFETRDEQRGWDGTYNGKPQDMGTYYYYLRYKCATGEYIDQKGEVLLMR